MAQTDVTQKIDTVRDHAIVIGTATAPITINQGAGVDEIVEALRKAGILQRLTTRLPEEQLRQLLGIIGRLTFQGSTQELSRIYHKSLPLTAHVLNRDDVPSLLITDLCDQPNIREWPPLFEFVERLRLAKGLQPALSSEFQQWVDSSATLVVPPVPAAEIERLRKEVRIEKTQIDSEAFSWLQIYLEPDWLNRTQERKQPLFTVELVLWSKQTPPNGLVLQSEQVLQEGGEAKRGWMLDEMPSLLDKVFANPEYVHKIPDVRQLVIEIVAPSDVLLYAFERWKRNNTAKTYGMYHPLVLRLRDRLTIPNPSDQEFADRYWRQKWNTFKLNVSHCGCEELEWRGEEELNDVFELQDDTDLACLGFAFPLLPGNHNVFDILRDAGIPIAIWLRGNDLGLVEQASLPELVKKLIQGESLSNLFRAVQKVRRSNEAQKNEKYIGNAMALLWDDPDHKPPKYQEQGVFV